MEKTTYLVLFVVGIMLVLTIGNTILWNGNEKTGSEVAKSSIVSNNLNQQSDILNPIWEKTWGSDDWNIPWSIASDGSGIYVAGWMGHYFIEEAFVLKYDLDGNLVWNKTWGGTGNVRAYSIAVAGSNLYVVGEISQWYYNGFLQKYDLNGNLLWNKTWSDWEADSIAVAGSNIYIAGATADWDAVLVLKYDLNGNLLWNKTYRRTDSPRARSIVVAGSNLYVCGYTYLGNKDTFVLKYDLDGNLLWDRTWGGSGVDEATSIAVTSSNIYVTGGTDTIGAGGCDVFVLKYDLNGNLLGIMTWGGQW